MPIALGTGVPFKSKFSGTVVDPGLALLQSATLWLNAAQSVAGEQSVVNQGTGGSSLDARYGSTTGVDTNDPLLLTHTGTNYLYLPGINGNFASAPDSAALSITGDIDVRVDVALGNYNPGFYQGLVAKYGVSGGYIVEINNLGGLDFYYNAGLGGPQATAAELGLTNGVRYELRVTVDVDNGAGSKVIEVLKRAGGTNDAWTLCKSNTTAGTISIADTADALAIGADRSSGASSPAQGKFYRAQVYSGIGGTKVFDADFTTNTNQSSFTESSSNAATVTINRATSGRKSVMVTRPVWLFGTDDYMEIADNALLDLGGSNDLTAVVVTRRWASPNNGRFLSKRDPTGGGDGWELWENSTTNNFCAYLDSSGGASAFPTNVEQTLTPGTLSLIGAIFDKTNSLVKASIGSTISSGVSYPAGTTDTPVGLFIGRLSGATPNYLNGEIVAVAVFRSALTSTQLGQIATYYGV